MSAPAEGHDPLDPANMAPVVVALCADEAQHVTGQVFHVWGGSVNTLRGWTAGELFQADGRWDADALPPNIHYHPIELPSCPRFLRPWFFGAACRRFRSAGRSGNRAEGKR